MAGYNQRSTYTGSNANRTTYQGGNKSGSTAAAPAGEMKRSEPILTKFLRPSKSGKSLAVFAVGDKDLVLPANTRVVITALSQKRMDALSKVAKEKGFQGATPTHELAVFAIEPK